MVNLLSTGFAFAVELFSKWLGTSWCLGSSLPRYGTLHFPLLKFLSFCHSISLACWGHRIKINKLFCTFLLCKCKMCGSSALLTCIHVGNGTLWSVVVDNTHCYNNSIINYFLSWLIRQYLRDNWAWDTVVLETMQNTQNYRQHMLQMAKIWTKTEAGREVRIAHKP